MSRRNLGQQISNVFALLCAIGAVVMTGAAAWLIQTRGAGDVLSASAMASVVFLASCAIVLYVMGRPRRALPPEQVDRAS